MIIKKYIHFIHISPFLDLNECNSEHDCDDKADCVNTHGGYYCSCRQGYTGNGKQCIDINECEQTHCHENAECVNTEGGYTCSCISDHTGNGTECYALCSLLTCQENSLCVNGSSGGKCICRDGFVTEGDICQQARMISVELKLKKKWQPDYLDKTSLRYQELAQSVETSLTSHLTSKGNEPAGFKEVQLLGFLPGSVIAQTGLLFDVTAQVNDRVASTITQSIQTAVSAGKLDSIQIDEKAVITAVVANACDSLDRGGCHDNSTCSSPEGVAVCQCNKGFTGDGKQCEDVDECQETQQPCGDQDTAICTNTIGSFVCSCKPGGFDWLCMSLR